ncbi:hypothetical protein MF428_004848 [Salmonella enterica]|nr:hypothetical protein [Salmonella enterica]EIW6806853.1 hypothetical protein [Salmonella enterica]
MLGGADNPNGELPSYITGADNVAIPEPVLLLMYSQLQAFRISGSSSSYWLKDRPG